MYGMYRPQRQVHPLGSMQQPVQVQNQPLTFSGRGGPQQQKQRLNAPDVAVMAGLLGKAGSWGYDKLSGANGEQVLNDAITAMQDQVAAKEALENFGETATDYYNQIQQLWNGGETAAQAGETAATAANAANAGAAAAGSGFPWLTGAFAVDKLTGGKGTEKLGEAAGNLFDGLFGWFK